MSRLDLTADKPTVNTLTDATAITDAFTKIETAVNANPAVTTSTFAAGPPVSPADGDVWFATDVDGNGTRWQFQYNALSASVYKWEFVGGAPAQLPFDDANVALNTLTVATGAQPLGDQAYVDPATYFTVARAGDYLVRGSWLADQASGPLVAVAAPVWKSSGGTFTIPNDHFMATLTGDTANFTSVGCEWNTLPSVTAGASLTVATACSSPAQLVMRWLIGSVLPVRVT